VERNASDARANRSTLHRRLNMSGTKMSYTKKDNTIKAKKENVAEIKT
jgi:hypothetical protein